MVNKDEYIYIV